MFILLDRLYIKKLLFLKKVFFVIQRYKGLREMDLEEFFGTTMDPKVHKLFLVTINDGLKLIECPHILIGNDVLPKKALFL